MANQRKKNKKMVGFYASPEEKEALEEAAKARGLTLSELLTGKSSKPGKGCEILTSGSG